MERRAELDRRARATRANSSSRMRTTTGKPSHLCDSGVLALLQVGRNGEEVHRLGDDLRVVRQLQGDVIDGHSERLRVDVRLKTLDDWPNEGVRNIAANNIAARRGCRSARTRGDKRLELLIEDILQFLGRLMDRTTLLIIQVCVVPHKLDVGDEVLNRRVPAHVEVLPQ
eukprot:scaffold245550_cov28-Tisochrysis_lutea.AAC.1